MPLCGSDAYRRLCLEEGGTTPSCKDIYNSQISFRKKTNPPHQIGFADLFKIKDVLIENDIIRFRNRSWCMFPALYRGDTLKIKPVAVDGIDIGDIAVFRKQGAIYSHRVIEKKDIDGIRSIVTRPDTATDGEDEAVGDDDLVGKVVSIQRGSRIMGVEKRNPTPKEKIHLRFESMRSSIQKQGIKTLAGFLKELQRQRLYRVIGCILAVPFYPFFQYRLYLPHSETSLAPLYYHKDIKKVSNESIDTMPRWHVLVQCNVFVIGWISFVNRPARCPHPGIWISNLYIKRSFRGMGFASELVHKTILLLKKKNIRAVSVSIDKTDTLQEAFFNKIGFKKIAAAHESSVILRLEI